MIYSEALQARAVGAWIRLIEEQTGSHAQSLSGALVDSGSPEASACPDSIAAIVAGYYAITDCGRLFHWRFGDLREIAIERSGQFPIRVNGIRWWPCSSTLLDRIFPDRAILPDGPIDWSAYKPDGPIPGIAADPLRQKTKPNDAVILDRPARSDELKHARRGRFDG